MEIFGELEDEIELEPISKTLIHGYGETHLVDDFDNKIIEIAPSKKISSIGHFSRKVLWRTKIPNTFLWIKLT